MRPNRPQASEGVQVNVRPDSVNASASAFVTAAAEHGVRGPGPVVREADRIHGLGEGGADIAVAAVAG